jgi:hypothetical protein
MHHFLIVRKVFFNPGKVSSVKSSQGGGGEEGGREGEKERERERQREREEEEGEGEEDDEGKEEEEGRENMKIPKGAVLASFVST